jgi:glycosyltransferase involved in cell wall biosynthesis
VRAAFDEQIFAAQHYGGISRLFAELARQFIANPGLGVDLSELDAPVVNRYLLDDPSLRTRLAVTEAGSSISALARYFTHTRPRTRVDVVHNTFYLPHGLAGYPGARRVVTVHDMIPELMPRTRRRLDFLTLKRRYVMSADHVICVSNATRDDLLRVYGAITAPVSVVYHGVDAVFGPGAPRVSGMPERYVLFVGNRGQYKDADVLIRAFASIRAQHDDVSLVFVGGGPFSRAEAAQLADLGISDRTVQFSLPDAMMAGAYGNALMCVFPSRFEGFGLPALEAMACGTPAVLARSTSLPEVGGDAAVYFSPGIVGELASAITELLNDDEARTALARAGLERSAAFSWDASARATAGIYSSLVG